MSDGTGSGTSTANARDPRTGTAGPRLRVDPVACDGIGMCAHVAPRLIGVDSWGYPMPASHHLSRREARTAAAAVSCCPRRALFLETPAAT